MNNSSQKTLFLSPTSTLRRSQVEDHVSESWIFVVAKKNNIPWTFNRGMTLSAIYCHVSKNAITKKKEGIMVYYFKKLDITSVHDTRKRFSACIFNTFNDKPLLRIRMHTEMLPIC